VVWREASSQIRIASGDWTAVTGYLEGTCIRPMLIGGGKTIFADLQAIKLYMVTIGHWKNDVMDEEWLMWDNQASMKQIGLVQRARLREASLQLLPEAVERLREALWWRQPGVRGRKPG